MTDKKVLNKELILKYPNLSGNKIYQKSKVKGIGIRKSEFYTLLRETRKLPEPSIQKRIKSIPRKYRTKPIKKVKAVKIPSIPFEATKFGKIVKKLEKAHNINEKKAIIHARKILKIPKKDYHKINRKDVQILLFETP